MGLASIAMMLLILVLPLAAGIFLIFASRKRGKGYPACGKCGYDVSGTLGTTNARCPECGSDFGVAGITPPATSRNKPALAAGIILLLVPATCIGGTVFMSRSTYTRARSAAVQAQQAAVAAQTQSSAMAQQTRIASATADPALVESFRPKAAAMTQIEAGKRASALLQEISQHLRNQTVTAENIAPLRAEYEAMNERAMIDDSPATGP